METTLIKSQLLYHNNNNNNNNLFPIINSKNPPKSSSLNLPSPYYAPAGFVGKGNLKSEFWVIKSHEKEEGVSVDDDKEELRGLRQVLIGAGAASIGLLVVLMGQDKAWAFGPEGPMVEEFWENVRRYALYALTVSTGVLYAVLQPIVELLKNPISAILIIIIIAGSFFIFSQILSAMFGVSDFAYQYAY